MGRVFTDAQRRQVTEAARRARALVSRFYVLSPREWRRMPFEVRTARQLAPEEIDDASFAQVRCYGVERRIGDRVVDAHDLYRICIHDHRVLDHDVSSDQATMRPFLLYILTHELVHVVRFGQRLQKLDLPAPLRPIEEASVDRTARLILRKAGVKGIAPMLERFPAPDA